MGALSRNGPVQLVGVAFARWLPSDRPELERCLREDPLCDPISKIVVDRTEFDGELVRAPVPVFEVVKVGGVIATSADSKGNRSLPNSEPNNPRSPEPEHGKSDHDCFSSLSPA